MALGLSRRRTMPGCGCDDRWKTGPDVDVTTDGRPVITVSFRGGRECFHVCTRESRVMLGLCGRRCVAEMFEDEKRSHVSAK